MGTQSKCKRQSVYVKELTKKNSEGKQEMVEKLIEVKTKGAFGYHRKGIKPIKKDDKSI